jgi:hypothetical protein
MESQPSGGRPGGLLFLQKHPSGDFYVSVPYCLPIDAKAENYKQELARVADTVAVFKDPVKALKVEDKKKRYANLQTLVQRYQSYRPDPTNSQPPKRVDLPAEESKLIMELIAALPAAMPDPELPYTVQSFFYFLQPQPSDGWAQPKFMNQPDYQKIFGEAPSVGQGERRQVPRQALRVEVTRPRPRYDEDDPSSPPEAGPCVCCESCRPPHASRRPRPFPPRTATTPRRSARPQRRGSTGRC